jgi:hypothetical protein
VVGLQTRLKVGSLEEYSAGSIRSGRIPSVAVVPHRILTRFWIGTLANVLIGLVSAYLGSHNHDFFVWLCRLNQQQG